MGKLDEVIQKLDSATPEVIDQGLLNIVRKNQSEAIDMNLDQLFHGRDANDQSLGNYKDESYAAFKNYLNPAAGFGTMDWHLTGDLYAGWFMNNDRFPVFFGSTDEKFEIRRQQNENAIGLDPQHLENFRQDIKPEVQELFRSLLQL